MRNLAFSLIIKASPKTKAVLCSSLLFFSVAIATGLNEANQLICYQQVSASILPIGVSTHHNTSTLPLFFSAAIVPQTQPSSINEGQNATLFGKFRSSQAWSIYLIAVFSYLYITLWITSLKSKEINLRKLLGASPRQMVWQLVSGQAVLLAIGLLVGIGAWGLFHTQSATHSFSLLEILLFGSFTLAGALLPAALAQGFLLYELSPTQLFKPEQQADFHKIGVKASAILLALFYFMVF